MNIGEIKKGDALYKKAFELRYLLFFKEHNLPKEVINDEKEDKSTHIAISQEDELIAYGRLSKVNTTEFQISQMVVSPLYQNQGYGVKLLQEIMQIAKNKGAKNIMLNARTTATNLYKKLGFEKVGNVYNSQSTGIPHIKMVYIKNT
ncbi:MAG TPA: GNAT family N-acetyltransferase [Nitrospirae bacterium]|nr:GNAT family N-acetyltransferase [Nitrospirota bacterium]